MNVLCLVAQLAPALRGSFRDARPRGAHDEAVGHVQLDVVVAEVGVESLCAWKGKCAQLPSGSSRASFGNHCATK